VYLPWRQVPWSPIAFIVRASGDPVALAPAVRQAVAQLDPLLPVYDVRPLKDYTVKARATQRFTMTLAVTFAVVALALACVGVYGVVAYSVGQRRHEFSVRLALGARPAQLIRQVLGDGVKLTAGGLLLGVVGGVEGARLLQNQLFGVSFHDVSNYAIAVLVLGACAVAACVIPAWRATANNAVDALRTE
jgi:putative ABC transport system permease protein